MNQITRQLALLLSNQPGALARMCRILNDSELRLYALSIGDTVDHCVVRLVTDDWRRAKRVLEEHNALVVDTEVVMIEQKTDPGTLGLIAEKLARAKINIDYAYTSANPAFKKSLLILRTSNTRKTLKVLNS